MEYEGEHWFDDCPMLIPTIVDFYKSNKKYLFAYADEIEEYQGIFFDEEPPEDIFIKSAEKGDLCDAIFQRNFSININNSDNLIRDLIFIDDWTN